MSGAGLGFLPPIQRVLYWSPIGASNGPCPLETFPSLLFLLESARLPLVFCHGECSYMCLPGSLEQWGRGAGWESGRFWVEDTLAKLSEGVHCVCLYTVAETYILKPHRPRTNSLPHGDRAVSSFSFSRKETKRSDRL